MNRVLVTGGEQPDYRYIKEFIGDAYICAADSGLDWCIKYGIEPDLIVGDMDSVESVEALTLIDNHRVEKLPVDKDDTDTVYALKRLKELGSDHITVVGGGGGRLDHLLGVVSLFDTELSPDIWITKGEVIYRCSHRFSLKEFYGSHISIFPLGKVNCSIKSFGLKWELDSVDWIYKSIGISNEVISNEAWIDCQDQPCLIIKPIRGRGFE